jgi:hypothetical protein
MPGRYRVCAERFGRKAGKADSSAQRRRPSRKAPRKRRQAAPSDTNAHRITDSNPPPDGNAHSAPDSDSVAYTKSIAVTIAHPYIEPKSYADGLYRH